MREQIKSTAEDLLTHPLYGMQKIYWKTFGVLHCLPYKIFYEKQYVKIHEEVLEEDKFLIIVLDAARYDYFLEEAKMFFQEAGDVESVFSSGRNTFEYVRNTWDGDHKDITYVSGAVPVNEGLSREKAQRSSLYQGYVPSEHLNIIDEWYTAWDDEKGAVLPEKVRQRTEQVLDEDKLVAHFMQPHAPYIGEKSKLGYKGDYVDRGKNAPDEYLWKKVLHGEITDQELRELYRSNLKLVLEEVVELVEKTDDDRRVVITSDHGELLGDGGVYEHKRTNHPILRIVPWMEVQ